MPQVEIRNWLASLRKNDATVRESITHMGVHFHFGSASAWNLASQDAPYDPSWFQPVCVDDYMRGLLFVRNTPSDVGQMMRPIRRLPPVTLSSVQL